MAYHEIERRGAKRYHYLVENVRVGRRFRKIKVYLGSGYLGRGKIKGLIRSKSTLLSEKTKAFVASIDPLYGALTAQQLKELQKIREENKSKLKELDWKSYYEWFVTKFTYNTSAIEGSTLSLKDTESLLFEKVLPKGKSLREINETQNHKDAFDYMLAYTKGLTKAFVLKLHKLLMHNVLWKEAGVFRNVDVYIRGVDLKLPSYKEVERLFKELMLWYAKNSRKYHPVVIATYFHSRFEAIHPFRDGNGRVGRLLLNFMLRKAGYPMIDIKNKEKQKYYSALYAAQKKGDIKPLANLIIRYLKMAYEDN